MQYTNVGETSRNMTQQGVMKQKRPQIRRSWQGIVEAVTRGTHMAVRSEP